MHRLVYLFSLLIISASAASQAGYVFVKKGIKKVRVYVPGDMMVVRLGDGTKWEGQLSSLRGDTMIISGRVVPRVFVTGVWLKRPSKKPFPDGKTVALIAAGSVLTSAGLAMSDKDHTTEALVAGPVIGFGPLLITHFTKRTLRAVTRKKYKMGNKFYLQVLDLGARRTI